MLVDSHCHLDFDAFDEDRGAVLDRARAAGIGRFVTISTRLSTFADILEITNAHEDVYCTIGIHPHQVAEEPAATLEALTEPAESHAKVVGIGETGLDYYYEHSPRDTQRASFRTHIAAARETGLPVIVHTRDADEDTARILQEEYEKGPFTGLIHCYSSGRKLAEAALELGLYISFSGILTFKNAAEVREIAEIVPNDRLLVETDAPYLAPVPVRGKRNEPAFVAHTAAALAGLKDLDPISLAEQTTRNFGTLFTKAGLTL